MVCKRLVGAHWGLERGYWFYLTVPNKSSLALQSSVRYWTLLHAPCMPTGCVHPVVQARARSSPAIATTRMTPRASRMACGPWPRPPLGGGWRCVCEPEGSVCGGLCAALALFVRLKLVGWPAHTDGFVDLRVVACRLLNDTHLFTFSSFMALDTLSFVDVRFMANNENTQQQLPI